MKNVRIALLSVALLGTSIVTTSFSRADDKAPTTQPAAGAPVNTMCPVSGDKIDPAITTVYQGKTYAFCCPDCIKSFKSDPAKYAAKAK